MPIRVVHEPIGLAMRLAQQAGRGQAQTAKWQRDISLLEHAQRQQKMEADITSRTRAFALQSAMARRMATTLTKRAAKPAAPAMDQVLERMKFKTAIQTQQQERMRASISQMVEDGVITPEQGRIAAFGAATGNSAVINAALKPAVSPEREFIPYAIRQDVKALQSAGIAERRSLYANARFLRQELEKGRFEGETDEEYETRKQSYRNEISAMPKAIEDNLIGERHAVQQMIRDTQATTGEIKTRPGQPSGGTVEPPEEMPTPLPPVPADIKKRVKGQRYVTPDGREVMWTGTKFMVRT